MAVDSVSKNVAPQITGAIRQASQSTGISFQYLLTTARIESGLNPSAKASTSSATGLYQFIEQTWLGTMKQEGAALGLGQYAKAITQNSDGRYEVADPVARAEIMRLRRDPETSAMMAGAFSRANAFQLIGAVGRPPTEGELYVAHFLGPDGAGRLINANESRPGANAAAMFPSAAAANRSIFYNRDGTAKSVGEVYNRLTGHFDNARAVTMAANKPAAATNTPAAAPAPAAASVASAASTASPPAPVAIGTPPANSYLSAIPVSQAVPQALANLKPVNTPVNTPVNAPVKVPDTAGITEAYAAARALPPATNSRPLFQAMFTDEPREGVNDVVASLWSPEADTARKPRSPGDPVRMHELFTDGATNVRGIFTGRG